MKIKTILVSQPKPAIVEKSPFYELTQKYGLKVDFFPFIKVEGISLREFRSQRVEILEHSAVLFTSRTSIDHFFRLCEEARINIPESMKYLCYTEAVALYLQKYIIYRKRKIFYADGTFTGYMELILKHRDEMMLLALSEPYKTEFASVMEKMKVNFNKAVLSRAVSCDLSGINPSAYDMAVLYSPAEVTAMSTAFAKGSIPIVATFGNGTARAAVDAGITVNVMAPTLQAPSMTKAIDLFISQLGTSAAIPEVTLPQNTQVADFLKAQETHPTKKSRAKRTPPVKTPSAKSETAAKTAVKRSAASAKPASATSRPKAAASDVKK